MSLINYLSLHPEIFMQQGEKHFFDMVDKHYQITEQDVEMYENSFATKKRIVGEKTPSYCYLQFAMDRIYNYNKDIKLVLILREPIARAFSEYNMNLKVNGKTLSDVAEDDIIRDFEEEEHISLSEITQNGLYFVVRGFYDEIIEYILGTFPHENLYIAISEEIQQNKQLEYNQMMKFLGVNKEIAIHENLDTHVGTYHRKLPSRLEKKLYHIYRPHIDRLYTILGRRIESWETYYKTIQD